MKRIKAIYPGSFDPVTNGHLDLIERGSKIFDELIVAILKNPEKDPLFDVEERCEMLRELTTRFSNVRVQTFSGLLVDYAAQQKAQAVLRGIRAISDYEYELQMALMNRKLESRLETVFMMPAEAYSYLSSRLVKEVFRLGGSVRGLVPKMVEERLRRKAAEEGGTGRHGPGLDGGDTERQSVLGAVDPESGNGKRKARKAERGGGSRKRKR